MKVWLLTNSPSPYQVEFLTALNRVENVELQVRFMRPEFRQDNGRGEYDFSSKVLKGIGLSRKRDELRIHFDALAEAWTGKHDVFVLSGLYTSPTFLLAALLLALRRKPFCLWLERPSETKRRDLAAWKQALRWPFVAIRFLILRFLFALTSLVICMGSLAKSRYLEMGLRNSKAANVPYCSNVLRYTDALSQRDQFRSHLGLSDKVVFLTSGQLIRRKGIDTLIQGYLDLAKQRPNQTRLLILGDGPEREALENLAAQVVGGKIEFLGHQDQSKLPQFFVSSDVFVFPTRHDGWGVVVNEAVASGLAVLATRESGAAFDLVIPNKNGFHFSVEDVAELSARMRQLVDEPELRKRFGSESLALSDNISTERGARDFAILLSQISSPSCIVS